MDQLLTFFRRLLAVIEPFAERLGAPGLALVAFLDSSFLSLPQVAEALVVMLAIRRPERWIYYSAATTIGSVAGCLALYSIARKSGEAFLRHRFDGRQIERGLALFRRYGMLAVIVPAFLPPPTPFKVFVLLAGLAGVRPATFILAVAIGRGFRFAAVGWLAYRYGARATQYISENLATLSLMLAGAILLAAVAAMVWRSRRRPG